MRTFLLAAFMLIFTAASHAQSPREIKAVRTNLPIKIDGDLGDAAWKSAALATNLTEWRPSFGKAEAPTNRTDVYFLYDDNAIYVGGYARERTRDSISTELVGRDMVGVNDFVGIIFDTYLDKINGFGYYVTPLGEQYDAKYSLGNEDGSWNSVFKTGTRITDTGWYFEMEIPYSAIRFSKKNIQDWGLNITRRRNKTGQQYMWNPVDPQKFGFLNQFGLWKGLENIQPPLRLSFSPYFSAYLNNDPRAAGKKSNATINGGMDVKYGISKAFTLDMTLIPDFGQVQSDNQVLNLTPFEVRYNENRTFFTEGTELFNKGNFFYSRRVGGMPIHFGSAEDKKREATDIIIKNPRETKLINATKISGRTASGLGIGVFNAVTKPQYAVARDLRGIEYEIETNPLTNYNIVVLDQTLKHNSSVTFVNTNVMRSGSSYDANVTAFLYDLYDKNIDWNIWGKVANSNLFSYREKGKTYSGINYEVNLGKFKGPFNFDIHQFVADDKYEQNDLGYATNNNYFDHGFWAGYKWTKPKSFYNNLYLNLRGNYSQRFRPRAFQNVTMQGNINGQLKNLWYAGLNWDWRPRQNDFYEGGPGTLFKRPASAMGGFWFETNRAKKYSATVEFYNRSSLKYQSHAQDIFLRNQYRFNDRLSVNLSHFLHFGKNMVGSAYYREFNNLTQTTDTYFGMRQQRTAENTLVIKYNFNNRMGLNFRMRHYWSKVDYTKAFILKPDGYLREVSGFPGTYNPDQNVNYFNIDMVYTWQFGPGSFINIGWKDAVESYDTFVHENYMKNMDRIIHRAHPNTLSLKVIYYLDYLELRKKKKAGKIPDAS